MMAFFLLMWLLGSTTKGDLEGIAEYFKTPLKVALQGGSGSGYIKIKSGTFRVRVTGYNKRSDLRLDIPAVTLDSASVNTLILTATDGGVLVNGITMVQKGAAKNYPTTLTRVRAVNALAGTPIVATTINGNNILPASLPPNTSNYFSFTAGASTTVVTVNSIPLNITSPTFAAGGDYTLLIWGDAATPQLSVLNDDNRLPTTSTKLKLRLLNAMNGMDDYRPARASVPSRSSSATALEVEKPESSDSSSSAATVEVSSALSSTPLLSLTDTTLDAQGVYTVFMFGTGADASGALRKER